MTTKETENDMKAQKNAMVILNKFADRFLVDVFYYTMFLKMGKDGMPENTGEHLKPIYALIKKCINAAESDSWEDADLQRGSALFCEISRILSEPCVVAPYLHKEKSQERHTFFIRDGWENVLDPDETPHIRLRTVAQSAIDYINALCDTRLEQKSLAPLVVCPVCDTVFKRKRSDHVYCTPVCKTAAWSKGKGKSYFAEKARNRRAAHKALKAGEKARRRRSLVKP